MRPIRRFGGTPTLISDRLGSSKSHDKINTLTRPSWSILDEDRRKLRSLFFANNYASVLNDKENRSDDASSSSSSSNSTYSNSYSSNYNSTGSYSSNSTGSYSSPYSSTSISTNGYRKDTTTTTTNGIQSYSPKSTEYSSIGLSRPSSSLARDSILDSSNSTSSNVKAEPEIIMNTPAFQLVCARRVQHRHVSADDVISDLTSPIIESAVHGKLPKSAMKKSQTDDLLNSTNASSSNGFHRSRWSTFKRSVSFADDKGFKLTEIRLFEMNVPDELPLNTSYSFGGRQASGFIADFILPPPYRRLRALQTTTEAGSAPVASSQIVLESYSSSRWDVKGLIAVRSNSEAPGTKRVFVRYTNDHWTTSSDNEATLTTDKSEPNIEKYSFTLPFPLRSQTGSKLEFKFGVRMPAGVGGVLSPITYWDDNHGSNYCFTFV